MFCRHCGKSITDKAAFCPYCGTKTAGQVSVSASEPVDKSASEPVGKAPQEIAEKKVTARQQEEIEFQRSNLLRKIVGIESNKGSAKKSAAVSFICAAAFLVISFFMGSGSWIMLIFMAVAAVIGVIFAIVIARANSRIEDLKAQLKRLDQ